jgi:hypothetical protein
LSFAVGDFVYLKVSPIRGTRRFQVIGKLASQYIGPYKVLQRIRAVAYRIHLPKEILDIHNVFHVPQLKKWLRVREEQISAHTVDLQDDLRYQEVPIKILDTVTKQTRTKTIRIRRVQWSRHTKTEATWKGEDAL